jgi:hypothetical protein
MRSSSRSHEIAGLGRDIADAEGMSSPPAIAPTTPLEEILIQDLSTTAPESLKAQLQSAKTLREVEDWMALGVLVRWLPEQMVEAVLSRVGDDPASSPQAIADAFSADELGSWRESAFADILGLILQLCGAMLIPILATGMMTMSPVLILEDGLSAFREWVWPVQILFVNPASGHLSALRSLVGVALFSWLALWGPFILERLRRLPGKGTGPVCWPGRRIEPLYACWFIVCWLHATGLGAGAVLANARAWEDMSRGSQFFLVVLVIVAVVLVIGSLRFAGSAITVNMKRRVPAPLKAFCDSLDA